MPNVIRCEHKHWAGGKYFITPGNTGAGCSKSYWHVQAPWHNGPGSENLTQIHPQLFELSLCSQVHTILTVDFDRHCIILFIGRDRKPPTMSDDVAMTIFWNSLVPSVKLASLTLESAAAGFVGFDFLCFSSEGRVDDTTSRTSSGNFVNFSNFNLYRIITSTSFMFLNEKINYMVTSWLLTPVKWYAGYSNNQNHTTIINTATSATPFSFCLTCLFSPRLRQIPEVSKTTFGDCLDFLQAGLDAFPVTQPMVSKYWKAATTTVII